jgi:hypothetical protein
MSIFLCVLEFDLKHDSNEVQLNNFNLCEENYCVYFIFFSVLSAQRSCYL